MTAAPLVRITEFDSLVMNPVWSTHGVKLCPDGVTSVLLWPVAESSSGGLILSGVTVVEVAKTGLSAVSFATYEHFYKKYTWRLLLTWSMAFKDG